MAEPMSLRTPERFHDGETTVPLLPFVVQPLGYLYPRC